MDQKKKRTEFSIGSIFLFFKLHHTEKFLTKNWEREMFNKKSQKCTTTAASGIYISCHYKGVVEQSLGTVNQK